MGTAQRGAAALLLFVLALVSHASARVCETAKIGDVYRSRYTRHTHARIPAKAGVHYIVIPDLCRAKGVFMVVCQKHQDNIRMQFDNFRQATVYRWGNVTEVLHVTINVYCLSAGGPVSRARNIAAPVFSVGDVTLENFCSEDDTSDECSKEGKTTDKSKTQKNTTQDKTIEKDTTEEDTTEEDTTEEDTTEEDTTEEDTTKEETTEEDVTEEDTTEEDTQKETPVKYAPVKYISV